MNKPNRPNIMQKQPTITATAAAKRHGISEKTARVYRKAGIDLSDAAAVHAERERRQRLQGTRQPSNAKPDPSAGTDHMTEAEARRRKIAAEARIKEIELAKVQGKVMDREEIIEAYGSTVAAFRVGLMSLVGELPPLLEGMSAPEIEPRLTAAFNELLESFSRRASEIVHC